MFTLQIKTFKNSDECFAEAVAKYLLASYGNQGKSIKLALNADCFSIYGKGLFSTFNKTKDFNHVALTLVFTNARYMCTVKYKDPSPDEIAVVFLPYQCLIEKVIEYIDEWYLYEKLIIVCENQNFNELETILEDRIEITNVELLIRTNPPNYGEWNISTSDLRETILNW